MNLRNSLLIGIAALGFGLMTPVAIAQTTDTNGQITPTGSNPTGGSTDQMNSGPDSGMAAKHKRHHKKHHAKTGMNSSSSEEATTEQLNRQQLGRASTGTAANPGSENAATYNNAPAATAPMTGGDNATAPNTGMQPSPNTSGSVSHGTAAPGNENMGTYKSPTGTTGSSNSTSDSPNSSGGSSSNNNNQPAQTTPPPQ